MWCRAYCVHDLVHNKPKDLVHNKRKNSIRQSRPDRSQFGAGGGRLLQIVSGFDFSCPGFGHAGRMVYGMFRRVVGTFLRVARVAVAGFGFIVLGSVVQGLLRTPSFGGW